MNTTVPKNECSQGLVFVPLQSRFLDIPQAPLCYWLRERFFEVLAGETLQDVAYLAEPSTTGNNERFMRNSWEVPIGTRWHWASRGGGYSKWEGFKRSVLEWEYAGVRIKSYTGSYVRNEQLMFGQGITYTEAARGALGVRRMQADETFCKSGPGIFPKEEAPGYLALLNSRFHSYLLRVVARSFMFSLGSLANLPVVHLPQPLLADIERACIDFKNYLAAQNPLERAFDTTKLVSLNSQLAGYYPLASVLHTIEGFSERVIFDTYELNEGDKFAILLETGMPSGWLPLVPNYDAFPEFMLNIFGSRLPTDLSEFLRVHQRLEMSLEYLADLKYRLRVLFEAGPGVDVESEEAENKSDLDKDEEQVTAGAHIPLPPETFLEELSQKLEIHPISVYWMLKEGIEKEGWRCLPEERRIAADRITVLILRLLGHLWPKQVEAGEPIPEWADSEGIIPMTEGTAKSPLLDALRERLPSKLGAPEAYAFEREFPGVMGKSLDQWLETDFFKHHTKQFKKRPIAWQIQSGPFSKKRKPAFACLVYYHKLNADSFPKLRTHYVGPLRQRYETELQGIEAVPLDARSDRQEKRRVLIENQIQELKDFDSRLERIADEGFGPKIMRPALRQAAIDDAMLHLKALWLSRLQDTIAEGPLPEWVHLARKTALECPIEDWIVEAFSHIANHCSRLGPRSPEQEKMSRDPEASDLAELIGTHSSEMIKGALSLGCNEWWQKVDTHLFRPFRDKIQKLRDEIKRLNDEANQSDSSLPTKPKKARDLDRQIKDIKVQIKQLKNQLDEQVSRASQVREAIEGWECLEAQTWEPWLGSQPLYDAISTLHGKQRPPATVEEFVRQESSYAPDINDGVRVNIAPIQKAGLLLSDVLSSKDIDKAISDRIHWRSDERRWCREGRLFQPGWWEQAEGALRGLHKGGMPDAPSI